MTYKDLSPDEKALGSRLQQYEPEFDPQAWAAMQAQMTSMVPQIESPNSFTNGTGLGRPPGLFSSIIITKTFEIMFITACSLIVSIGAQSTVANSHTTTTPIAVTPATTVANDNIIPYTTSTILLAERGVVGSTLKYPDRAPSSASAASVPENTAIKTPDNQLSAKNKGNYSANKSNKKSLKTHKSVNSNSGISGAFIPTEGKPNNPVSNVDAPIAATTTSKKQVSETPGGVESQAAFQRKSDKKAAKTLEKIQFSRLNAASTVQPSRYDSLIKPVPYQMKPGKFQLGVSILKGGGTGPTGVGAGARIDALAMVTPKVGLGISYGMLQYGQYYPTNPLLEARIYDLTVRSLDVMALYQTTITPRIEWQIWGSGGSHYYTNTATIARLNGQGNTTFPVAQDDVFGFSAGTTLLYRVGKHFKIGGSYIFHKDYIDDITHKHFGALTTRFQF
jgi:hypothetical protein